MNYLKKAFSKPFIEGNSRWWFTYIVVPVEDHEQSTRCRREESKAFFGETVVVQQTKTETLVADGILLDLA